MNDESSGNFQDVLGILALIEQGEKDILEGKYTQQEDFFRSFEKRSNKS